MTVAIVNKSINIKTWLPFTLLSLTENYKKMLEFTDVIDFILTKSAKAGATCDYLLLASCT